MSLGGRLVWVAVAIGAAVFAVQGGEYSTTDLWRQRAREHRLTVSIDTLQHAIDSLRALEHRLRTDPVLQETVAREEFGMVRGDRELLYRFADPPAARDSARVDAMHRRDTLLPTTTRGGAAW